jgi:hypothetical protein
MPNKLKKNVLLHSSEKYQQDGRGQYSTTIYSDNLEDLEHQERQLRPGHFTHNGLLLGMRLFFRCLQMSKLQHFVARFNLAVTAS